MKLQGKGNIKNKSRGRVIKNNKFKEYLQKYYQMNTW